MRRGWGFLIPWCKLLSGRLLCSSNPTRGFSEPRHFVDVKFPRRLERHSDANEAESEEQFRMRFHETREALALLAAVHEVDYDVWLYLLGNYCGVIVGDEGEERVESIHTRFKVILDWSVHAHADEPDEVDFDLVRLCGVHQREHTSAEYLEALTKIASLDKRGDEAVVDIKIPVHVSLRVAVSESLSELEDVVRAEQIIKQQWREYTGNLDPAPGSLRCTFVLEPMDVCFNDTNYIVSPDAAETLQRFVQNDVWFSGIQYFSSLAQETDLDFGEQLASKKIVGQLTRSLFGCTRRSPENGHTLYQSRSKTSVHKPQLGTVNIHADVRATYFWEGVCSAMVHNQTAQCIELDLPACPRKSRTLRSHFQWLAYGFFTQRALENSAWEKLVLRMGEMKAQVSDDIALTVNAKHPEELLCYTSGVIDEREATLIAGAPVRWKFKADGRPDLDVDVLLSFSPIHFVRTFGDDGLSPWVDAIVPGFGRCQVRRGDLIFDQSSKSDTARPPKLRTLVIEFPLRERKNQTGLPNFLATIGSCLKSLTLSGAPAQLDETVVFQHCPSLEELALLGDWLEVELNFTEYRASGGALSELRSTDWRNFVALSTALCSADNPIAKCIRRLRIYFDSGGRNKTKRPGPDEQGGFQANWHLLVKILDTNPHLEYLEVMARRDQYEKHLARFRQYHHDPIPRAREPLSTKQKLAFLSVFSPPRSPAEPDRKKVRGMTAHPLHGGKLNQQTLCSIFAFAALPELRQVFFRHWQ